MRNSIIYITVIVIILCCICFLFYKGGDSDLGKVRSNEVVERKQARSRSPIEQSEKGYGSDKRAPFRNLKTPREKQSDLVLRLRDFRLDMEGLSDPNEVLSSYIKDALSIDDVIIRNNLLRGVIMELARVDLADDYKLSWFANYYPSIKGTLKSHMDSPRTMEESTFCLLYANLSSNQTDPYKEVLKINNLEVRNQIIKGLLPYMITLNSHGYSDIMKTLDRQSKEDVEVAVIREAINNRVYQKEALSLYLDNRGGEGNLTEEVGKMFNNTAWFWKNSEEISGIIEHAERGTRRDLAIENMIELIHRKDPGAARTWLSEIDDSARVQKITNKLFKE